MEKQQDYSLYKYYKGEKENPFVNKDKNAPFSKEEYNNRKWWAGEKTFHDNATNDPDFVKRMEDWLKESISKHESPELLRDESISIKKRTLVFYLGLWSGKWFPYDGPDSLYVRY